MKICPSIFYKFWYWINAQWTKLIKDQSLQYSWTIIISSCVNVGMQMLWTIFKGIIMHYNLRFYCLLFFYTQVINVCQKLLDLFRELNTPKEWIYIDFNIIWSIKSLNPVFYLERKYLRHKKEMVLSKNTAENLDLRFGMNQCYTGLVWLFKAYLLMLRRDRKSVV